MPTTPQPRNRGPAAAAENRAAVLAAARHLFAERGYRVPLSIIARAAGVGQGVLYRHFASRLDLAYAVFEDNFAELEHLAASDDSPECLGRLWAGVVRTTIESTAFVDLVLAAGSDVPADVDASRLERLFATPLATAQAAGRADPSWTTGDLLLLLQMVYGVAIGQLDRSHPLPAVRRALELVDHRMAAALDDADSGGAGSSGGNRLHTP